MFWVGNYTFFPKDFYILSCRTADPDNSDQPAHQHRQIGIFTFYMGLLCNRLMCRLTGSFTPLIAFVML